MTQHGLIALIGTTKGAFLIDGTADRSKWSVRGPFCNGWSIGHVVGDPASGRLWAGGGGGISGAGIWRSEDHGQTWDVTRLTSGYMDGWAVDEPDLARTMGWTGEPLPFEDTFTDIWSLHFAHGVLYAGTKPATLLRSLDFGVTWEKVEALTNHPSANRWDAGAAGLVLHTIITDPGDPNKLWVGISAAGVFASEDGGATWERRNRMTNAAACKGHEHAVPTAEGDVGYCVHNMMRAPGEGDVLYQQNHHGVWRSADGGRSWDEANAGLPSHFGFPIRVHPRDPETIWTLPLNGDSAGRFPPDAAAAVWRSRDGGNSWEDCRNGLPQEGCYFTVLRQAMAGDTQDPAGVYFGSNSGSVFGSFNEGDSWTEIARHLPTILSVEVMDDTNTT